MTQFRLVD